MRLFAISDLHLSFSGTKPMDIFGPWWEGYVGKVEKAWRGTVGEGDVVCLPGDFSWAMKIEEAAPELLWLGSLPGKKILLKGNHDYWWSSISKVRSLLPEGMYALQNDSIVIGQTAFGGARGWVDARLDFSGFPGHAQMNVEDGPVGEILGVGEDRKIYERELMRLEQSLASMDRRAAKRVALLHFPPTGPDLSPTEVTGLLEKHRVDTAVFGHVHRSGEGGFKNPFGEINGVEYYLASADYIDFAPVLIGQGAD